MIGFTGAAVDRADNLRLDETRLAELAAHGGARMMKLDGLDPVVDEETVRMPRPEEVEATVKMPPRKVSAETA